MGIPCSGSARAYVEPMMPKPTLWILGHGRIAECLCHMGALIGFNVVIDDPMAEHDRYPETMRLTADDWDYGLLKPGPDDCLIISTQHKGDHQSMLQALGLPSRYIALIASTKRPNLVLDYLREEGIDEEQLARVCMPLPVLISVLRRRRRLRYPYRPCENAIDDGCRAITH